ncbi:hypothetical protein BD413DRAFT_179853 [Trametes elegans]|nr:hypothetical protein BD413DRAFT_179853 [Trametes elegans]
MCLSRRQALPGLLAVLHGTLYVKQADGDWLRFDQLPERDRQPSAAAMQESSGSSREPTDAGGTPPPIQVIHQCDYSRTPRIRQAAIALVIAYDDLRLRDALDGTGAPQRPDAPAFAQDDPVGSKLSIFVDFPHFTNKQHTVRFKDGQQPISRARLANLIARMLFAYMECHTVLHAGEAISFDRLVLRSVRLASKATLQPEIGVLPAV